MLSHMSVICSKSWDYLLNGSGSDVYHLYVNEYSVGTCRDFDHLLRGFLEISSGSTVIG